MTLPVDGWQPYSSAIKMDGKPSGEEIVAFVALGAGVIALLHFGAGDAGVLIVIILFAPIYVWLERRKVNRKMVPTKPEIFPPELSQAEINEIRNLWIEILKPDLCSFAIFSHGTCVIVQPGKDTKLMATEILKTHGLLIPGTPLNDFRVIKLESPQTYVVGYHHPAIYNLFNDPLVSSVEAHREQMIGFLSRGTRCFDAETLKIVHVENLTSTGSPPGIVA